MAALIYLFEDDEGLRGLLTELLTEDLGARVVTCDSIGHLQQLSSTDPPQLIVADFWGTSHLTLLPDERQQVEQLAASAPMVLVSARHWAQDTPAEELGLAALVAKPIDLDAFVQQVRQILEGSKHQSPVTS